MTTLIRILTISIVIFISVFQTKTISGQKFSNPLEYMEFIGDQHHTITENLWDYIKAASHSRNAKKIESKRKELIKSTSLAKMRIKRLPDYEGDGSYRDSVVSYLEISYLVLKEDYEKIVNMEEIAEESYDLMEAYIKAKKLANEKLNQAAIVVRDQQEIFADTYGINLIDSDTKIGKRISDANEVYDYYNNVYLIFFKCYKQEAYVMEALERKNLSALEQNRKSLIQFSKEGLYSLDTIMGFEGDYSLCQNCRKAMVFFKDKANNEFEFFSNFILKQENLEAIQGAFERKSSNQRTQKEIDEYNKIINEFNAMVNDYNAKNNLLNNERNEIFNSWNKTSEKFINKNVP